MPAKIRGIILFLFLINCAFAQDNTRLHEFVGGQVNFEMTLYSSLFYGVGSRHMLSNVASVNSGVESIYWNPAALNLLEKTEVFIDYAPPISIDPANLYDFQDAVNREVDSEFKTRSVQGAPYHLPVLNTNFEPGNRLVSFGFAVPWKKFAFGFLYYNPFELQLNMLESGFRALLINEGAQATAFRVSGDVHVDFNFFTQMFAISAAYEIEKNIGLGLTLERHDFSADVQSNINFYGSLSIDGGEAVLFNDPSRSYPNSLFTSGHGKFAGSGWGFRLGGFWQIDTQHETALSIIVPPDISLSGRFNIINNTPAFYSGGAIDENRIDPNRTTATNQVRYLSKGMKISVPWNISLSYAYHFTAISLVGSTCKYFHEFSYDYANIETNMANGNEILRRYIQGWKPNIDFRLGVNFGLLRVAGGVLFADSFSEGFRSTGESSLILPMFSMAFSQPVTENLRIDGQILALSLPLSRISLAYNF